MLRRWSQYLNRCVSALASDVVEALGARISFSLELIMVNLEGGRYIGPILPVSLTDFVAGWWSTGRGDPKSGGGSSNCSGGGNKKPFPKVDSTWEPAGVRASYDTRLPSLYLRDEENLQSVMEGSVLPILHGHIICKN